MRWSTKVIATVVGVGMLYSTLSIAQPAEGPKAESMHEDSLLAFECGVFPHQVWYWGGWSVSWWSKRIPYWWK